MNSIKIIAFYSFKGGVGRSLSLLNIAYILSKKYRKKVGLIDLDVESSGLHHILNIDVEEELDLLNLLLPKNRDLSKLGRYVKPIKNFDNRESNTYLIPTLTDPAVLGQLTWDTPLETFLNEDLFPTFSKVYNLDFLFIDGRTGLSRFSAFALKQAVLVLLFCRLDRQNEFGISRMVKVCNEAGKPFLVIVSGCPMIKGYQSQILKFERQIKSKIDCVLPYYPELYFNEFIVSKKKPKSRLTKAYEALASQVLDKVI